jgi:hypothetical protein
LLFFLSAYFLSTRHSIPRVYFNGKSKLILYGIKILLVFAVIQVFNFNISNYTPAIIGFRFLVYFLLFLPISRTLFAHETSAFNMFFNYLPWAIIVNIFFGISQIYFPTKFSTSLLKTSYIEMYSLESTLSYRPTGFFQGTVQYALFSATLIFLGFILLLGERAIRQKYKALLYVCIGSLGLFFSMSRAVLVATLIIIAVYVLKRVHWKRLIKMVFVLSLFVISLLFLLKISQKSSSVNLDGIVNRYSILLTPSKDNSFREGRIERWKKTLPVLFDNPEGLGIGSTMYYNNREYASYYRIKPLITESIFLDIWMELGFIPFAIFSIMSIYIIVISIKILGDPNLSSVTQISICIVLLFYIPGFSSPNFSAFPFTFLAAIGIGSILLHYSIYKNNVSYKINIQKK